MRKPREPEMLVDTRRMIQIEPERTPWIDTLNPYGDEELEQKAQHSSAPSEACPQILYGERTSRKHREVHRPTAL